LPESSGNPEGGTWCAGVEAALQVMRARHYPRQASVISQECDRFHDHEQSWDPPRGPGCYTLTTLCAGCGTEGCKELPLVEALLGSTTITGETHA
jgi:hypothetical protein